MSVLGQRTDTDTASLMRPDTPRQLRLDAIEQSACKRGGVHTRPNQTVAKITGALTKVGTVATGTSPDFIEVNAAETYAYVVNSGSYDVYQYSINSTTDLLTYLTTVATGGTSPLFIAINPAGTYAYVANSGSGTISVFSINSTTGAHTAITGSPFTAASAYSVTRNPAGTVAYLPTFGSNTVSVYTIDSTTGGISSAVAGSPSASGTSTQDIAFNSSGTFAYSVSSAVLFEQQF